MSIGERVQGALARVLSTGVAKSILTFHEGRPRLSAAIFFLGGVGWDAATIFRIDSLVDNAIIVVYLSALGLIYTAATLHEAGRLKHPALLRFVRWYPLASQFLLGALVSMFVFFYSQSASWTSTSIFLAVLILLLVANEVLHDRIFSARMRLALLFFVLASWLVYAVPIAVGSMSASAFTAGLTLAAGAVGMLAWFLWKRGVFADTRQALWSGSAIVVLFVFLILAYAFNWIPPVPMAVREAGIFHEVKRDGDEYRLRYARPAWYRLLTRDDSPFLYSEGDTIFVYTAVFAPTRIDERIMHVWESRNPQGGWRESDRIDYLVAGGRDGGFRGYTRKRNVAPGRWRVSVMTEDGRLLSRIPFTVRTAAEPITHWKWRTD